VPQGAENARCAPYPVKSCPVAGAHCPTPLSCCSKTPGCELSHDCREFLPAKCSPMPAVNCAPNIPPSGWAVLGWKPSPAAYRSDPKNQMPTSSCRAGKSTTRRQCSGGPVCESRSMKATLRLLTLRYVPERPPLFPFKHAPCNPTPDVPQYMTCSGFGSDKLSSRVHFKFTFPGRLYSTSLSKIFE